MDTVYRRIDHGSVRYVKDVDEPLDVFDVSFAVASFCTQYPTSAAYAVQSDIVEDNPFDRMRHDGTRRGAKKTSHGRSKFAARGANYSPPPILQLPRLSDCQKWRACRQAC